MQAQVQLPTSVSNAGNYFPARRRTISQNRADSGPWCRKGGIGRDRARTGKTWRNPRWSCAASTPSESLKMVHAWTKTLEAAAIAVSLVRDLQPRPPWRPTLRPSRQGVSSTHLAPSKALKVLYCPHSSRKGQEKINL